MDNFPCEINDIACWKEFLPSLPCDANHLECWKSITIHKFYGSADKVDEKVREAKDYVNERTKEA